jgi:DnaK suppressor protein
MTREYALTQLHANLLSSKERLGRKLASELAHLHDCNPTDAIGDSADLAFEADGDEISARLAEFDDRELSQIERALTRWDDGTYGICESCQKLISLVRLVALPYATSCIHCERAMEKLSEGCVRTSRANWARITDGQIPMQDPRINLAALEKNLSGSRRY